MAKSLIFQVLAQELAWVIYRLETYRAGSPASCPLDIHAAAAGVNEIDCVRSDLATTGDK
jgi:hypothetical protein